MMIDFKKMDNEDFVFINKKLNDKEEKAFSDFLKARRARRRKSTPKKRRATSEKTGV